jgi:gluconokinase
MVIVVMGAAGAGKTTVGRALALALGWPFHDADDLHDAASIARMRAGQPLTDADRGPWLDRVRAVIDAAIAAGTNAVVACSALKAQYRRRLAAGVPQVRFVFLDASPELLRQRIAQRTAHFAPVALVNSQLADLEPPFEGLTLDAARPIDELVEAIRATLPPSAEPRRSA